MFSDPRRDAYEIEQCSDCSEDVVIKRRPHQGKCPRCARATRRNEKVARAAKRAEAEANKPTPLPDHVLTYADRVTGVGSRNVFDDAALAEAYLAMLIKRGVCLTGWIERYRGGPRHAE